MPAITDSSPSAVASDLRTLATFLDQSVPPKKPGQNLLIATWNLEPACLRLADAQMDGCEQDSPKRDLRGLLAIGEIVRRFDVVAIQEVKGDLRAMRDMLRWLNE